MTGQTRYLSYGDAEEIVTVARAFARATGEPSLAPPCSLSQCDGNLIASALASPQASFGGVETYPDILQKAAVLTYALAKSQACPDGNKRIALILVEAFLGLNGLVIEADEQTVAGAILAAAESAPSSIDEVREWLCGFFAANIRPE